MKIGFSTMEAVASELIWDIIKVGPDKWKSITRLTPEQTYEKVINRGESVAMSGIPSYIWGKLVFDKGEEETNEKDFFGSPIMRQYCELDVQVDLGLYQQGLWLSNERSGSTRNIRYNVVADECNENGALHRLFTYGRSTWGDEELFDVLIRYGLKDNQRFLFRIEADYSTDYWGESDLDWQQWLIYAEQTEVTEEWMEWLLESAAYRKERVEDRQRRDAIWAEKMDSARFLGDLMTGKSKSKLKLPGTQAHADAVEKKNRPRGYGI